ncbi:hypothetical protein ACFW2E_18120, partial [Streptomyces sp. NPDC058964]
CAPPPPPPRGPPAPPRPPRAPTHRIDPVTRNGVTDATLFRALRHDRRPALTAGDADTDGHWPGTPMFIGPLARRPAPCPCSTTAYTAPGGTRGPLLREDGSPVSDRPDVYRTAAADQRKVWPSPR